MWRRIGVLSVLVGVLCFGSVGFAAPPVLEVSPTYLEFSAYEGSANPENQIVSIWRGGGNGPLNWEVIEDCNWLTVNPTSGKSMGEVDDVNLSVDISGLAAGSYNCQLTVDAGTAANSPQIVDVNLIVIGPILELSATQFEFTAIWGGPNPSDQILSISNSGGGTLNWEITEDCNWLVVEPNIGSSSGEVDDVNLSVDISGFSGGIYNCNLTVSDPNAENNPQTVGVLLLFDTGDILVVPSEYGTIQGAIDAAVSEVDTVVVTEGTYYENISFGGKNIVLTSTDPNNPNVVAATIIDAGGSGTVVTFSGSESTSCVLTGFTITGGYATSSSYGGGITGNASNATISSCIIKNNISDVHGGGLHNCDGDITNCSILDNRTNCNGGGLYDCDGSISNCRIMNNVADGEQSPYICKGGGLYGCDGIIANCIISGNMAGVPSHGSGRNDFGGGLHTCSGRITNCIIADNKVYGYKIGGGLHSCGGDITNNVITGNVGTYAGLYRCSGSITNCIIWGNTGVEMKDCSEPDYSCVEGGSGGTGNINVDPLFADPNFHLAVSSPCIDSGSPTFFPAPGETDIDGEPRVMGGRVDMGADEFTAALVPTIGVSPTEFEFYATWGAANPDTQILTIRNIGAATLNWEIIENCSWLEVYPNNGQSSGEVNEVTISVDISGLNFGMYDCNLTILDPCAFNSPQIVPVNLSITGPIIELSAMHFEFTAIGGGTDPEDQILTIRNSGGYILNWTITEDCDWLSVEPNMSSSTGEPNDVNLSVDISGFSGGIYNCNLTVSDPNAENNPQTVTVILRLGDSDSQLHVPSEYGTIQEAIDVAVGGDEVVVSEGTYIGTGNKNLDYDGKAITVRSTDPEDPCVVAATVIDCQNSGRGFYFHSGEDANSIVAGLTVKNGKIEGTYGNPEAYGGGIYCSGASPTIVNSHILNNSAHRFDEIYTTEHAYGGGISCISNSHPTIINCEVRNNLATAPYIIGGYANAYGGGIYCSSGSTVAIYDSRITSNIAHGGMWHSDASWIHYPCGSYGGGVYISGSTGSSIKNCVIANNQTVLIVGEDYEGTYYGPSRGAGIYCGAQTTINSCTICGNNTDPDGVGVWGDGGGIYGNPTVINSIIWANLAISQISGSANITYSDVESGWAGTGNIDADPCFADPCNGDYHLKSQAGRWDPNSENWVTDANTSPCIDAGNPGCPLGDEPNDANNIRINMGAYGGTAEASKSPANWALLPDLTNDRIVDFNDLAAFVSYWLESGQCIPSDLKRDQFVNFDDFVIFADNWLWQEL